MVTITNEKMTAQLNIQEFETNAQSILGWMGYADFDLGILLTDNQEIQSFNRDFRKKDVPTDILSFPFHTDLKAGEAIEIITEDDKNIGDLIISLEYIQETCKEEK